MVAYAMLVGSNAGFTYLAASLARMGISGPEQAAITTGLRRRAYGDLTDAGDPLGRDAGQGRDAGPPST